MMSLVRAGTIVAALSLVASCAPAGVQEPGSEATDVTTTGEEAVSSALRERGFTVRTTGTVEQPFFAVTGKLVSATDEKIQVFTYSSESAAERDAALVSLDGSKVGNSVVSWVSLPHFFHKGEVLVLYVGVHPGVLQALESVLGPQFAGSGAK